MKVFLQTRVCDKQRDEEEEEEKEKGGGYDLYQSLDNNTGTVYGFT